MTGLFLLSVWGCVFAQTKSVEYIGTFPNGPGLEKDEFEYVYQKNNGGPDSVKYHSEAKIREYLELYVRFKRKVIEAEKLGLDTTKSFQSELSTYIKQLSQPYLIEKEALNELIKTAYERSKYGLKVSHILVKCDENAPPQDTLKAYQRALSLRDSVVKFGKKFSDIAVRYSDDPSAKDNAGYLSYFTAFDFVYPFENGAFNTPLKSVSMPVRTKFGYHLIHPMDKKPTEGITSVAHILVRHGATYEAKDSVEAEKRVREAYEKLKAGEDFAKIAELYSDDPNSKNKGGDLGTKYIGLAQIQDLKYELKPGSISEPFKTPYGWHIVKVTLTQKHKSFEESKNEFKNRVTRDGRAQIAEEKLVANIKKQYNYQFDKANFDKLVAAVKDKILKPEFTLDSVPAAVAALHLFSFAGIKTTNKDFIEWLDANRKRAGRVAGGDVLLNREIEAFVKSKLFDYEEKQLSSKYPEFRFLTREYRDGILLFTLTEQRVWRKAMEDTAGLEAFYNANKDKFMASDRLRVVEYRANDEKALRRVDSLLNKKLSYSAIDSIIRADKYGVRVSTSVHEKGSTYFGKFDQPGPGSKTSVLPEGKGYVLMSVKEFLPAGPKSFDDAKSEAITLYQNKLEEEWNAELEKKYPFTVNDKALKSLFK
jgi:peptidyl-prolyl cis-trans isomerase SurA